MLSAVSLLLGDGQLILNRKQFFFLLYFVNHCIPRKMVFSLVL